MTLKRFIAKEVIIFYSAFILLLLIFSGIWIKSKIYENKADNLLPQITAINAKIITLNEQIDSAQLVDVNDLIAPDFRGIKRKAGWHPPATDMIVIGHTKDGLPILRKQTASDSLGFIPDLPPPPDVKNSPAEELNRELGIKTTNHKIDSITKLLKGKIDKLKPTLNSLENTLQDYNNDVYTYHDLWRIIGIIGLILLIIIYPVRFLIVSFIWAIKNLRSTQPSK